MEAKIIKVTDKGQISLPVQMRESMNIEKGDELIIIRKNDKILIEKISTKTKEFEDDFSDLLKISEESLKKLWDNKEDKIWDIYLEK